MNDLDWQQVRLGLLVCYASNKLRQTLTLRYRLALFQFTTINLLVINLQPVIYLLPDIALMMTKSLAGDVISSLDWRVAN